MKITKEIRLSQFPCWSEAAVNAEQLTLSDFHELEEWFEMNYDEPLDETFINDMFWFDFQFIVENVLGYVYNEEYGRIER